MFLVDKKIDNTRALLAKNTNPASFPYKHDIKDKTMGEKKRHGPIWPCLTYQIGNQTSYLRSKNCGIYHCAILDYSQLFLARIDRLRDPLAADVVGLGGGFNYRIWADSF